MLKTMMNTIIMMVYDLNNDPLMGGEMDMMETMKMKWDELLDEMEQYDISISKQQWDEMLYQWDEMGCRIVWYMGWVLERWNMEPEVVHEHGRWVHVMTAIPAWKVEELGVAINHVMGLDKETCVSNYEDGYWFTWRNNDRVALELEGTISLGWHIDVCSSVRANIRVQGERLGAPRFEGWIKPNKSTLRALLVPVEANENMKMDIAALAVRLGVGYKEVESKTYDNDWI